jgi:hypothetical protein
MTSSKDKIAQAMMTAADADKAAAREEMGWQARLVAAQMAMAKVTKDSRVAFGNQRYAYTSAEDMIGACREALLTAGLALFRSWTLQHTEAGSFVVSDFTLAYPGGSQVVGALVPFPIVSTNGKGEDKAVATALTSSLGYFLRDLLLVPKEDDAQQTVRAPEMDARDDRKVVAKPPTKVERLGLQSAVDITARCKRAGTTIEALAAAMRKAGHDVGSEAHQWPEALRPRIMKWLDSLAPQVAVEEEPAQT